MKTYNNHEMPVHFDNHEEDETHYDTANAESSEQTRLDGLKQASDAKQPIDLKQSSDVEQASNVKQTILTRVHSAIALASALAIAIIADRAAYAMAHATSTYDSVYSSLTASMPVFTPFVWFGVFWLAAFAVVTVQFLRICWHRSQAVRAGYCVFAILGLALSIAVIVENYLAPNNTEDGSVIHTVLSAIIVLPALAVLLTQIPTELVHAEQPKNSVLRWLRGCVIEPFANWGVCARSITGWFRQGTYGSLGVNNGGVNAASVSVDSGHAGDVNTAGVNADSTHAAAQSAALERPTTARSRGHEILVGLLMLIPVCIVAVPLLMQSDEIFKILVQRAVFSFDITAFLGHTIFVICLGWLLFSLFAGVWLRIEQGVASAMQSEQRATKDAGFTRDTDLTQDTGFAQNASITTTSTSIVLLGILALYAVFCAIQVRYLVFGLLTDGTIQLPAGLTYAQYARSGFFQLIVVVLLNLTIFGLAIRYCKASRLVHGLLVGLLGLSMLMAGSAALKLGIYIDAYGLTWLRLVSVTFIPVIAIIIVLAGIRLRVNKLPLIAVSIVLVLIWWIALGIMNPSNSIMWFNTAFGYDQPYM